VVLCPNKISVENLLIANDGDRQYRQQQEQQKNGSPFTLGQARFRRARIFLDHWRIGREIFSAGEINCQADQHPDAGRAETVMPIHLFAERSGDERRGDDSAVDEQVVNLERIGAPVGYKAPTWLARLPLKQPTPVSRQVSAIRKLTSKAMRKCPADMRSAPIVIVRVRPRMRLV